MALVHPADWQLESSRGESGPWVPDERPQLVRAWKVIAEELSHETDSARILELSKELNQALREQQGGRPACPIGKDCSGEKAG